MGCMPYLFLQIKCSSALRSKKSRSSTENSECELRVCFKVCEDELKFGGSRMWWEGDHIDLDVLDLCGQEPCRTRALVVISTRQHLHQNRLQHVL